MQRIRIRADFIVSLVALSLVYFAIISCGSVQAQEPDLGGFDDVSNSAPIEPDLGGFDDVGNTVPVGGSNVNGGGGSNISGGGGTNITGGGGGGTGALTNPLKAKSITEFLLNVIEVLLIFAVPIVVFFIIYSGFLFVTAQGDTTKISTARSAFTWAVVGGVIVLGAKVIIEVIQATVNAF